MTDVTVPVGKRLVEVFDHLGIERAHVVGAVPGDWRGLASTHADRLASLNLVCPTGFDPAAAVLPEPHPERAHTG